jgi:hypothetical protein
MDPSSYQQMAALQSASLPLVSTGESRSLLEMPTMPVQAFGDQYQLVAMAPCLGQGI